MMVTAAKTVVVLGLALSGLSLWYTSRHLQFITDRNELVSTDKRYLQLDKAYDDAFHGLDQLVVVAESPNLDDTKTFVRRLGAELQADTAHVQEVFYRLDTSSLDGKKLLLLSATDLHTLRKNVEDAEEVIQALATRPGLNTLLAALNHKIGTVMVSYLAEGLFSPEEPANSTEKAPLSLAFLHTLLVQMNQALSAGVTQYHSPWAEFFGSDELANDGFLVSDDQRFVYLLVAPQENGSDFNDEQDTIAALRAHIATLRNSFPQVRAGVTGDTALGNDEMLAAQADTGTATALSLLGVTLLYTLFFRSLRRPLLIALTVIIGLTWTMGLLTLTVGHVSVLSVFVAPLLIGLCDAYGVYLVTRYEEERDLGKPFLLAFSTTFACTIPSLLAGAGTTALAFYSMTLADFRGVQELGFVAGTGVLSLLLAALTVLPALLVLTEEKRPWRRSVRRETIIARSFARWGRGIYRYRRLVLVVATAVSLLCLLVLPMLRFDYNLLHLQARGTESVAWELRLIRSAGRSSWFALATAPSLTVAVQKASRFASLPSVEHVETVASLVPEHQEERLELVRALNPFFAGFPATLATPAPIDIEDLRRSVAGIRFKLRGDHDTLEVQGKPGEQELTEVQMLLAQVLARLTPLSNTQAITALERLQQSLFQDFASKWALLQNNLNPPGPITLADVPAQLRTRFVSADGQQFLLQIYPRQNIWDGEPLREFVSQLRQVDADVTGNPVIGYESIRAIKEGYVKGGLCAAVAIVLVTFLTLQRGGDTLRALLPVGCGLLWTGGLMWLFGLQFNLANLVVIPLIIGVGVDGGINFIRRVREEARPGWKLIGESTGQAIALYSLDSMAGFSSLLVARHYGIFSMGLLLTLAVGTVLLASLTVLPLLLTTPFSQENRVEQKVKENEPQLVSLPTL